MVENELIMRAHNRTIPSSIVILILSGQQVPDGSRDCPVDLFPLTTATVKRHVTTHAVDNAERDEHAIHRDQADTLPDTHLRRSEQPGGNDIEQERGAQQGELAGNVKILVVFVEAQQVSNP
jgi:hypothetical protein